MTFEEGKSRAIKYGLAYEYTPIYNDYIKYYDEDAAVYFTLGELELLTEAEKEYGW